MDKSIINVLIVVFLLIIGISTRFLFLIDGESILPKMDHSTGYFVGERYSPE